MASFFTAKMSAVAVGAALKGIGMICIAVFGFTIVYSLQASAAKSVKLEVMTQVNKRNTVIQAENLAQAKLEGELKAKQEAQILLAEKEYKAISLDDIRACPIERLRCATP